MSGATKVRSVLDLFLPKLLPSIASLLHSSISLLFAAARAHSHAIAGGFWLYPVGAPALTYQQGALTYAITHHDGITNYVPIYVITLLHKYSRAIAYGFQWHSVRASALIDQQVALACMTIFNDLYFYH